jgi:hypothetical protein
MSCRARVPGSHGRPFVKAIVVALGVVSLVVTRPAVPVRELTGATHYVSPTGRDTNPGTLALPWRTFGASLPRLRCGDTLVARGGTYRERVTPTKTAVCPATAPITVKRYRGERPVIKGLLWLQRPSHWTIDGINVTWDSGTGHASEHMVKLINGVGWVFKDAEVWGAHSYAAIFVASTMAGEPDNWTIANNCVHDTHPTNGTNQDQLLYVDPGLLSTGGLIQRNILFNATNGMGVKLGGPAPKTGGAAHVTVRYNTIYNTSQNIMVSWRSTGNDLYRNLVDKVNLDISPNYGNIRGYELSGLGNIAFNNWGDRAKTLIYNDRGFLKVVDGGGNIFPSDPQFDSVTSCGGFHPLKKGAKDYGRFG